MLAPSPAGTLHVEGAILGCLFGSPPALARDDVCRVPVRPVMLGAVASVLAMVLLCFLQKLCQRRDVEAAEASSGRAS